MEIHNFFNVLQGFNFDLLDNSEFQEDAVREEIVVPIIKGLGYTADKPNQIIRSRKLLHPYVSIGSQKKDIYIIPDYLFEVDGRPAWVLDAKAPTETIIKSKNVEQAYSYAIHSEVRVNFFALCNGKEFALYDIQKIDPILHFPIKALPVYWENLKKFVSPANVFSSDHYVLAKDLGLHLKRLGFDTFESLIFPKVPIVEIGQLDPDMFSLSAGLKEEEERYVVTFDFGYEVLNQLVGKIPTNAIEMLLKRNQEFRQVVRFGDKAFLVNIDCKVGDTLQENKEEIFLPLIINRILE
jgi:hypothetical protein